MPQAPKQLKVKPMKEEMVPTSLKRPKELAVKADRVIRKMGVELDKDLNHSQVVCALEELMVENSMVYGLLVKKISATP